MPLRANKQLITASERGDRKGILKALQLGANINFQESSELETALIRATENGHLKAVEVLLENNALISVRNRLGWTAFHHAAFYGHEEIVEAMVKHGGDVDIRNHQEETPIMLAACYGKVEALKVLLQNGARADCCDWRGKSVLAYASKSYVATKEEKEQCIEMLKNFLSGSRALKTKNRSQTKKEQGNAAFRKRDYERAALLYSDAINENQTNYLLYSNRSAAFFELGEYMLAKDDAIKCVGLNADFAKGYLRLAMACMALGEYEIAAREAKNGLKRNPNEEMTKKLSELQRKATNARKARDTISEDIVVGNVKGFPASSSLHASRDPIFASGQDEDELIKAWVTLRGHLDASVFNDQICLMVLLLNLDEDTLVIDNYEQSFLLTLRNKSVQSAINPECDEIDGESVSSLKAVHLRQRQWAVFTFSFHIPGGMELYENEALKKCCELQIKFKQSGIQDDVICHFDLSYIRNYYNGFRPGLVCSQFGPPPDPLNPTWVSVKGWSGTDEEYADYDDEKYMDGFALIVKDTSSSTDEMEHVHRIQITSPPSRNELVSTIEKSFHRTKSPESRPCVLELSISGSSVVQSDADLSNIKDLMKFEVKFGRGCCFCRKPETHEKFSRCGMCRKARYCSRKCQAADWPRHKSLCLQKSKMK